MCGIVGSVRFGDQPAAIGESDLVRMRDRLEHRGPDDAGLWLGAHAAFGHRRLSVLDPTPGGRQPFERGGGVLVYNGELYNDTELRRELEAAGERFTTSCDTETVAAALAAWGPRALTRFRGMYALAWYKPSERTLLLARDPLGIKPLCYWADGSELVFASEAPALLAHPRIRAEPDVIAMSAYLTTIRTTLGERTLFAGVRTLRPGESLLVETHEDTPRVSRMLRDIEPNSVNAKPASAVRAALEDSVARHLRSDVPICSLLSGGLDSSACALLASRGHNDLRTYCAGAASATADDFEHAQLVASHIGSRHAEAVVDRQRFRTLWREMVDRQGVPLSTPNETAIYAVASALRADGCVVTLSGEGADELLAGYDQPLKLAAAHVTSGNADPGVFQLRSVQWLPTEHKPAVLAPDVWQAAEQDAAMASAYREQFGRVALGIDPMADHLRFHRLVNLEGLLRRLDTATMLASVEGRTPFADAAFAGVAEGLAFEARCDLGADPALTKRPLREAFTGALPDAVVRRPKASFPLPFQEWVGDQVGLLDSAFARQVFTTAAIETVRADANAVWSLAWPMLNLAMWGRRWWG